MPKKEKLKKALGFIEVFCIASGAMISSGLFILPGLVFAKAGPAVIFAYILAGLLVIPAMFTKIELATAMPKSGGTYFYIERSMGPALGTLGGLACWFSLSFKSAFALLGMGVFTVLLNPNVTEFQIKAIAIGFCLFFTIINIRGIKLAGNIQNFVVLALIGILVFYISRGFLSWDPHKYVPFAPYGWSSVFGAAGLVFISYGGVTKIASIVEEVKDPGRNIPLGMIISFIIVLFLYASTVFVTVGLVPKDELTHSLIPISLGAGKFAGNFGILITAFAALLAFISTANAGIMSASRFPLAMARDKLLPKPFGHINPVTKTPHFSILFTGLFMAVSIALLDLENLVKIASTMMLLLFLFAKLSLIIMRESKIQNYQPKFKSPFYPWIQIIGIIGYTFLIFEMGSITLSVVAIFAACGLFWYLIFGLPKVRREFALLHVVERITNKALTTYALESELRGVLRDRDEIIEDRFDHLIKKCTVLDLEGPLLRKDFFAIIAKELSQHLSLKEEKLIKLFEERERQASTAVRKGLAIPHIIVEGDNKFDILLVRCKEGIIFSDDLPPVHAVFILIGSSDERNFHLRALMSIAQITEEKNFDKNWMQARNPSELRDIVLLGERRRHKK